MSLNLDKKTLLILVGIFLCLLLALIFGLHILWPALDPVATDMIKIFSCGAACGLLAGIWLGRRIEREFGKKAE